MSSEVRQRRVADQIRAELSDLILNAVKDPRLGFATVTEVRMSRDLGHARVFVSVLGDQEAESEALNGLRHSGGFLRREVGRRVRLRHVPELRFEIDRTLAASARIEQLLQDNPPHPDPDEAGGADTRSGDDPPAELHWEDEHE